MNKLLTTVIAIILLQKSPQAIASAAVKLWLCDHTVASPDTSRRHPQSLPPLCASPTPESAISFRATSDAKEVIKVTTQLEHKVCHSISQTLKYLTYAPPSNAIEKIKRLLNSVLSGAIKTNIIKEKIAATKALKIVHALHKPSIYYPVFNAFINLYIATKLKDLPKEDLHEEQAIRFIRAIPNTEVRESIFKYFITYRLPTHYETQEDLEDKTRAFQEALDIILQQCFSLSETQISLACSDLSPEEQHKVENPRANTHGLVKLSTHIQSLNPGTAEHKEFSAYFLSLAHLSSLLHLVQVIDVEIKQIIPHIKTPIKAALSQKEMLEQDPEPEQNALMC